MFKQIGKRGSRNQDVPRGKKGKKKWKKGKIPEITNTKTLLKKPTEE